MLSILAVGAGGFVGAVCRYLIGLVPINETLVFPIKTFLINVVGCMVIGLIAAVTSKNSSWNPQVVLFMKVGLCGGFTTFSTFALETTDLLKNGHSMVAFLYVLSSVLVGVGVIFAVEYFGVK
jgi:CrcB protein